MSAEDHKQALPPGFRLGAYRVARVLGVGGFGVTYLCEHTGLAVQVAVKEYLPNEIAVRDGTEVHPKSAGDREGFEWGLSRFLDEARTLARFEHPNVVRVRDCFEANNTAYIVMDYEDGEPLDTLLRRHGTLTEAQLNRALLPVVDGLRQVHAAGFLHRDIKPANVFVRRSDESPVLLDFGSARQALGRRSRSVTAIASAGYSPPEQYESDGHQGAWTDIYALSALCYRAITGDVPMEATRRQSQLLRTRTDPLPKLAEVGRKGYSPAFLEGVDWGLRVIETERPEDLDEWLHSWRGREGISKAADQGDADVQYDASCSTGDGAPKDASQAAVWYKAAEQGHAVAQNNLGNLYYLGEGVPKDAGQAAIWYRKAAKQGHAAAQANLGVLYDDGEGVPKDAGQAAVWYRKAAGQGDAMAQYRLGLLYDQGTGVPKDAAQAALWHRKAAEQGYAWAQYELGRLYARATACPRGASKAAIWFRKAAEQGHARAQYNLGVLYATGDGVPRDAGKAAIWFRKAAEQGHARAQYNLGVLYYLGEGVPKDAGQAAIWYRKAAKQGHAVAQNNLGNLYYLGEGVPKDAVQAAMWYRKAAEQRNADARHNLGLL